MRIVIAPDSFKGSLSALEAAQAMERGVKKVFPHWETTLLPLSDGGEGLVEALVLAGEGRVLEYEVQGPLGAPVRAQLGLLKGGETAVIEMAQASGLTLLPPKLRDPQITTTYGTGELIKHALDLGCRRLVIGLGGSATNDGGLGMAQALGFAFLDAQGEPLGSGGAELVRLARIDPSGADPRLKEVRIEGASDVANPLTGKEGATYIYGPQKGAAPAALKVLERALQNYERVLEQDLGKKVGQLPGAGAAGGLGAGLMGLLDAKLNSGIELVLKTLNFREKARGAQLVLTGEGKFDAQSAYGKVPWGVGRCCLALNIPAVVLAGTVLSDAQTLHQEGITAFFSVLNEPLTLEEALQGAAALLEEQTAQVVRLFWAGR